MVLIRKRLGNRISDEEEYYTITVNLFRINCAKLKCCNIFLKIIVVYCKRLWLLTSELLKDEK